MHNKKYRIRHLSYSFLAEFCFHFNYEFWSQHYILGTCSPRRSSDGGVSQGRKFQGLCVFYNRISLFICCLVQRFPKRTAANARFANPMQQAVLQALQHIQNELHEIQTKLVRANNSCSSLPSHPIMPVQRNPLLPVAALPASFPQTMAALRSMSSVELMACLNYYSLPTNGVVGDKIARLAEHLGALRY